MFLTPLFCRFSPSRFLKEPSDGIGKRHLH